ncbi:MAG: arylsulfatase A-like enzyme/Tfp pilus assembly protein PilF [Planctomycetota bacterium]
MILPRSPTDTTSSKHAMRDLTPASTALLLGTLCAGVYLTGCGSDSGNSERPNLLLVTTDTVRTDHLGCYGYEAAQTPELDALAARGVLFEEAYTPAPMTLPAHSTLMTGLLPPQHGARVNGMHKLAEDVPTLAEQLGSAGYRTGAFIAAYVLDGKFGLNRGFDIYDDDLTNAYEQELAEGLSTYRAGNLVVDSALAWLEESEQDRPFFAWVHLYDAHFPWHPHGDDVLDPNAESGSYDGEIAFVDQQIARLNAYLRENEMEQNTVIIAVADHGEGLGDHHEIEHAYLLNEEVLHVPWIMAGPGIAAGHRVDALVTLADFQPTILELLDLADTGAQGRSLVAALGGEQIESGESYAETDLPWTGFRWAPQRSLTTERWKYVRTPQTELYDRSTDRAEYANLAETKRDVRVEMEARLSAIEDELGERESDVAALGAEELEQLEALGYAAGSVGDMPEDTSQLADMKQRFRVKDLATELRKRATKDDFPPQQQIAMAQELVNASPETPGFHSQLGEAFAKVGDYERALPELELTVEMCPTDAGAHYTLGDTLQQSGQTDQARVHIEMALELAPDMASAHVAMGNIQRSDGRTDLAAGEYSEALRLRPEYPEAYFNLAQTFRDRALPHKVIENLELAIEHKPGWGLALITLSNVYAELGQTLKAAETLLAAVKVSPRDPGLHNDLALLLVEIGQPAQAREHYLAAIQLAPNAPRAHLELANMAFDYGNNQNALVHYEEALRLAPEDPQPAARLARFLAITSDPDLRNAERAVSLAERATEMTGGRVPLVLDTLAAAYGCAGRFEDALSAAQVARQLALDAGDAQLARAIEERLGYYSRNESYVVPQEQAPAPEAPATAPPD